MEYAMEADPGRLTASFPTFDSREDAERAASFLNARTPHVSPVRILCRNSGRGGAWNLVGDSAEKEEVPGWNAASCWCSGSDSWSNLGTAEHLPDGTCPIRAYWLAIEDSEFPIPPEDGNADA